MILKDSGIQKKNKKKTTNRQESRTPLVNHPKSVKATSTWNTNQSVSTPNATHGICTPTKLGHKNGVNVPSGNLT